MKDKERQIILYILEERIHDIERLVRYEEEDNVDALLQEKQIIETYIKKASLRK